MAEENKVFDVASPGKSKPETGAKPMVVGHKIMQDPSIKAPEESIPEVLSTRVEKTIKPLSESKTKEESSDKKPAETPEKDSVIAKDKAPDIKPLETEEEKSPEIPEESTPEPESETPPDETPDVPEQSVEEKQKSEDSLELEREEKLQAMIKSKEYFAPIKEAKFSAFKTFMKTFVIVALVGILALVALIDLETIDLGVKLPFDFL